MGTREVVKLLLATGRVDIESKDKCSRTPLLWATLYRNAKVVKLLLATGQVDVNSKDKRGQTLLWWVTLNKNAETVKLLLENGANIAAAYKHVDVVK